MQRADVLSEDQTIGLSLLQKRERLCSGRCCIMYIYTYIYIYMYVCVCVCIYTYTYVYIYIYMHL